MFKCSHVHILISSIFKYYQFWHKLDLQPGVVSLSGYCRAFMNAVSVAVSPDVWTDSKYPA